MLQCVVNFERGRVRVYDKEDLDIYFNFNKEDEDNWKTVVESAGYSVSDMQVQVIRPTEKEKAEKETIPDLLDILNTCTHRVREDKAGDIVTTYLNSITELLNGKQPKTEPVVEQDWALCAENYPKGIVIFVPCVTTEECDECINRCKALHDDLQMLYDEPAEIFMEVIK